MPLSCLIPYPELRLLDKQQIESLTPEENQELDHYEAIDDYLSFVNRTIRNLHLEQSDAPQLPESNCPA